MSRSINRLEARLGVRLLQRTTRAVAPTEAGEMLRGRSQEILALVEDTFAEIGHRNLVPRGRLRVSVGFGFGLRFLSDLLPTFIARYPEVDVSLDMTSRNRDLVADNIDLAIRMGPLPASSMMSVRLGTIKRYLCASPAYLGQHGTPQTPFDLHAHDIVEMPGTDGRPRPLLFANGSGDDVSVVQEPRISVNDVLTTHRLVCNGAGIAGVSAYLCLADFNSGRLVRLLPEWSLQPIDVTALYPNSRDLSPVVRAFVELLKEASRPGSEWQDA